jgi:hypothetical protein
MSSIIICFSLQKLLFIQTELCLQSIFDIVYPSDIEIVRQQLTNEKKASSTTADDSPIDSKCKRKCFFLKKESFDHLAVPTFATKQNCLEIGNRRTFSCRINSRKKRSNRTTTTNSNGRYSCF